MQGLCAKPIIRLALVSLLWLGCAGDTATSSAENRVFGRAPLRVGISPDYAPIAFEKDGELTGIEPEMARMLAADLGRSLEFIERRFPELVPALEAGEIDVIMAGMSVTPERSRRVAFATPYLTVGQMALVREADLAIVGRPKALRSRGARVGYEKGTTGARFVHAELDTADAREYENPDGGVAALRAGEIDYFIHDAPTIWHFALDRSDEGLSGLYTPLTQEYLAWAVARQNVELRDQLDGVLANWMKEGRLSPVLLRWIPLRVEIK
jgi:polar amino acid transport system substrate-binding protein